MKTSLSPDDLWNIGFDYYFDGDVKFPKSPSKEADVFLFKGYDDAKLYREALNRKEDSNA